MDIHALLGSSNAGFSSVPYVTSWCIPIYFLATIRLFISIYCFTTIFFSFKWFATHTVIFHLQGIDQKAITFPVGVEGIRQSFSYFTYLSYWGLGFYFFFASLHSFVYARRAYSWLEIWPRYLQAMHGIFYSSITTFPLLISTVYWGSMWTRSWWADDFDQWSMISIHAMNSVFATFEIVFANTSPHPFLHLGPLLLIMTLYLGVAYITKATEGIYVYLWLDPHSGAAKIFLHILGYGLLLTAYFITVRYAIMLRYRLTRQPIKQSFDMLNSGRTSFQSSTLAVDSTEFDLELPAQEKKKKKKKKKEVDVTVSEIRQPEPSYRAASRGAYDRSDSRMSSRVNRRHSRYWVWLEKTV